MPAILISIGGSGGEIVNDVRRKVAFAVETAGNTQAARQSADEIRYFLVDTRAERFHKSFPPTDIFDLPRGGQKFGVDRRVAGMWQNPNDPFFRAWWPATGSGDPYSPGDFYQGAGQVRVKGKLAYRFHLSLPDGEPLSHAVREAAGSLMNALGPAATRDNTQIPVYLICSLGGGTGSGMALTLAHHLKQALPRYCVIIGVFLLASITEKAPHTADQASIWANTDAALREIDYFQQRTRDDSLTPYLEWPGAGNVITGSEPPFLYCYLFGATNRRNLTLPAFRDYIRLISECLVAEIMEPLSMAIAGPHAQFVQQYQDRQSITGRPTSYASAARADIVFPVERVTRHLARRFGATVLRRQLQPPKAEGDIHRAGIAAADAYLADNHLLWTGGKTLRSLLYAAEGSGEEGQLPDDEEPIENPSTVDEQLWKKARQQAAMEQAEQLKSDFDQWRNLRLIPFVRRRRDEQIAKHSGQNGRMAGFIEDLLTAESGDGYLQARAASDRLVDTLKAQATAVYFQINGEPEDRGPDRNRGLKHAAATAAEQYQPQLEDLRNSFHWRQFFKPGAAGKNRFLNDWYGPYSTSETDLAVTQEASNVYQRMLQTAERIQQVFLQFDDQLQSLAKLLEDEAKGDLGTGNQGDILEVGILDHPALVDYHFFHDQQRMATQVNQVARHLLTHERGVRATLHDELDQTLRIGDSASAPSQRAFTRRMGAILLAEGTEIFRETVERTTIWHALLAECEARQALPQHMDDALRDALDSVSETGDELDEQGVGDSLYESRLLVHYIERKLNLCKNRAHPFWLLDPTQTDDYGPSDLQLPYPLAVLAYDRSTYKQVRVELQLPDLMLDIQRLLQVRETNLPGKYAIRLYAREGVVPLFFLDDRERLDLRNRGAQVAANKPLYGDRRYGDVLDQALTPGEMLEDTVRYALACGILLGLVESTGRDSAENGEHDGQSRFTNGNGFSITSNDLTAIQQKLQADENLFETLRQSVDQRWSTILDEQGGHGPQRTLRTLANEAERHISGAQDDVNRAWWMAAAARLRIRPEQGKPWVKSTPQSTRMPI